VASGGQTKVLILARVKRARIEKGRKLEFVSVGPRSKRAVVYPLAKAREQDIDKK
jgi:hypothetical protein